MARPPNRPEKPGRKDKKNKAKQRANTGKARLQARRPQATVNYIQKDANGQIEKVLCKLCGDVIKNIGLVPNGERTERRGDRTFVFQKVALIELANYTELTMEMDDGSFHVTPICRRCGAEAKQEDLEDMYDIDMGQADTDENTGEGEVYWELWADRLPNGKRKIRGRQQ